jgi:hypothetical protein
MVGSKKTKKSVSFSEKDESSDDDSGKILTKKEFFKQYLEQHISHNTKKTDTLFSNCYESYTAVTKAYAEYSAEIKRIKKEQMPFHEKIIENLKLACRYKKSSDAFREKGKLPQANGFQKKAEENVQISSDLYNNNDTSDIPFDPAIRQFLEEPSYQGLDEIAHLLLTNSKNKLSISDNQSTGSNNDNNVPLNQEELLLKVEELDDNVVSTPNNTKVILNREELEQLENDNKNLEKKVRTYKKYVNEITTEIEEALPFIQNDDTKERLTYLLSKKQSSNSQTSQEGSQKRKRTATEDKQKKQAKKSKQNEQTNE